MLNYKGYGIVYYKKFYWISRPQKCTAWTVKKLLLTVFSKLLAGVVGKHLGAKAFPYLTLGLLKKI